MNQWIGKCKWLVLSNLVVGILSGCGPKQESDSVVENVYTPLPEGTVNFSDHIAPILFENCSVCHRPGQSAPFSLLTYEDARKRSQQIAEVTGTGYMPPWLPDHPAGTFINERILTAVEKGLIRQWHEEGAAEGDPSDLPDAPQFADGWRMGDPDLVVRLTTPFPIPAEGEDIYRNFVIPIENLDGLKFVRTVDFRPLNPQVVHHMVLLADLTNSSRMLDEEDELPGFPGIMSLTQATLPFGQFHGWTPGKEPYPGTEGISWPLQAPIDLVLQVHMQTTGKPEELQVEVGLYFSDGEPKFRPYPLVFRNKIIDIPAGEKEHHVKSSFQLPVDVQVLSVYPHAHYLGKKLMATARMADGSDISLINIPDWDFDWQDEYRFAGDKTVLMPAGTVVEFDYTFDNSAENPQNPTDPPVRVLYGQNATDEMAELLLQVLTKSPDDLMTLDQYAQYNALAGEIEVTEWKLKSSPEDIQLRNLLATYYMEIMNLEKAAEQFDLVLKSDPEVLNENFDEHAYATVTSAQLSMEMADIDKAEKLFSQASDLYQTTTNTTASAQIFYYRGEIAYSRQQIDQAISFYTQATDLETDFPDAWNSLAWMHLEKMNDASAEEGVREEAGRSALEAATKAVEITGRQEGPYLLTLGRVHERMKNWDSARSIYQETLKLARELEVPDQVQRIQELIANLELLKSEAQVP